MKCGSPTSRTGTFKPSKSRLSPGLMTTHVPPARKRTPTHHWPHRGGNLYHHYAHLRVPALHTDRQRHGLQHAPKTANATRLNNSFTTCASFRKTGSPAIPPHKEKSNATTTRSKNGSPPNHQPQPSPACTTNSTHSPASTTTNAPKESSTGAPHTPCAQPHHPHTPPPSYSRGSGEYDTTVSTSQAKSPCATQENSSASASADPTHTTQSSSS